MEDIKPLIEQLTPILTKIQMDYLKFNNDRNKLYKKINLKDTHSTGV